MKFVFRLNVLVTNVVFSYNNSSMEAPFGLYSHTYNIYTHFLCIFSLCLIQQCNIFLKLFYAFPIEFSLRQETNNGKIFDLKFEFFCVRIVYVLEDITKSSIFFLLQI